MKTKLFLPGVRVLQAAPIRRLVVAVGLALMIGANPVRATLEKYDLEIGRDHERGLPYTAALQEPVAFHGATAFPFDFGAVSGSATIEFIVSGDPGAGGASGYLAVGSNATWNLRFEQWNNTGQLGFTHLGVADYLFTPPVNSPGEPTHIVYRFDADTSMMDLFVNGEWVASRSAPNWEMPSGPGWLGARSADTGLEGMVGTIQRVTVYDSAVRDGVLRSHAEAWLEAPDRVIVFDSDAATISVDGEVQAGGNFLGVPYSAMAYNGRTRFLFAGDLTFQEGDVVRGIGSQAISIIVSGDVTLPEGALLDVSAQLEGPGPGGGEGGIAVAGGAGGDAGTRGTGGSGGAGGDNGYVRKGIPDRLYNPTAGSYGNPGNLNGTGGSLGASGTRGADGRSGYRAPNTGGLGAETVNRGPGGSRGSRAGQYPDGGGRGTTRIAGPSRGGAGAGATVVGGAGNTPNPAGAGLPGKAGSVLRGTPDISGGGGGASGQGGGGAGGGGGGGGGAGGGGGGGGGGDYFTAGDDGKSGQRGGHGGHGGHGGVGGTGGLGGHGGGALEIISYGRLVVAGELRATGARGLPGAGGAIGAAGAASEPGYTPATQTAADRGNFSGGNGGRGSRGGAGGSGGIGGQGGAGGGGAGGSVKLWSSVAAAQGSMVNVSGGEGGDPGLNDGPAGRLIFGSNTEPFAGALESGPVLEEYPGLRELNAHLSDQGETPYLPHLAGGSDIAGLLNGLNAGSFPAVRAQAPANARIALLRITAGPAGYEHAFPGYDYLLFLNLTGEPLPQPALGAGAANYLARFRDGGLARNPVFGGEGAGVLELLEPWGVYATLVPTDSVHFSFGYTPESTLVFQSMPAFPAGSVAYLSHGTIDNPGTPPEPVLQPDPVIQLPEAGPVVNFAFAGELTVELEPAEVVASGAGWNVAGQTPVYLSGTTATGLPTGPQTVRFSRIAGWLPPRDRAVTVLPPQSQPQRIRARYAPAEAFDVGDISPRFARAGEVLGFYLPPGTTIQVVSGSVSGPLRIQPDGWFSYEPAPADRLPFEVRFNLGAATQTVQITPQSDLPPEQAILALQPVANPPDPGNRDYTMVHETTGDAAAPVNFEPDPRVVTLAGKRVVLEAEGDSRFYDLIHDRSNLQRVNIYAEELVVRAPVKLPQAAVTVYARELRFEDPTGNTASLDTTPATRTALDGNGAGLNGGNILLRVARIVSDPTAAPRLILQGGDSEVGPGGDSGLLTAPFAGVADFAEIRGGRGTGAADGTAREPVLLGAAGDVPPAYQWVHPLAVRSVLLYARDLYFLGFIPQAESLLREYDDLLTTLDGFATLPEMPDADHPALQFAELHSEISRTADRIANKLDFFGNPAGWVPMLSFEANFLLTNEAIQRAMRVLYLSHWLTRSQEFLEADQAALEAARDALGAENEAAKAEFPELLTEIDQLEEQERQIELSLSELKQELLDIEDRLERRAQEIVDDRNFVPFWKKALRTAGSIMQVVPLYQPALGAVGSGLDIISNVDEQEPLDTVLQLATVAGEYKVASLRADAQNIDDELNPPAPKSDQELERDELLTQAGRIETGLGVASAGAAKIKEFLATREAPKAEIDAELARIRAADPQFNQVAVKIESLMAEKEMFMRRLTALQNRLRELPGIVLKNRLAMQQLAASVDDLGAVLDPQALSVVQDAEQRARIRLRRHFYLLAKSFEYRLLEPYRAEPDQVYDPVQVFDKIVAILEAAQSGGSADTVSGQPHLLSPTGFDSLAAVFEEELSKLSDRIILRYESGLTESTFSYSLPLPAELLPGINDVDGETKLNLHELGFLAPNEEGHRIADLRVTNVAFILLQDGQPIDPAAAGLLSAVVDIEFVHSGLSRLTRDGRIYLFNHFRDADPARNPIKWTAKLNLLNGSVAMVRPSLASQSLLATLLGNAQNLKLLNFSRPAAWADVAIRVRNLNLTRLPGSPPAGGFSVNLQRLDLGLDLDFYSRGSGREIDIRIVDTNGQSLPIQPQVWFDLPNGQLLLDANGRRDGVGNVTRAFVNNAPTVIATVADFYGNTLSAGRAQPTGYAFTGWLDQAGNALGTAGGDRILDPAQPQRLQIGNSGFKRFFAVYEYVGDSAAPILEFLALESHDPSGGTLTFLAQFDQEVVGVEPGDFAVVGLAPGDRILSVTGDGSSRRVTVSIVGLTGQVTLAFLDDDSVLDYAGNSLAGYGRGNGDLLASAVTLVPLPRIVAAGFAPDGFRLELTGEVDDQLRIEASSDLENWTPLGTIVLDDGTGGFTDPEGMSGLPRFYRAVK